MERTRAVERVEALFGESRHGGIVDLDEQAAAHEALAKQETADFAPCDPAYDRLIESVERDDPVDAVHELGSEESFRLLTVVLAQTFLLVVGAGAEANGL